MIFHGTTPVSVDLSASKKRTLRKLYLALALISAASIQTACSATISGSESTSASTPDAANDAAPVDATTNASSVARSEEHTSELQSRGHLVCRLLLEKKKETN